MTTMSKLEVLKRLKEKVATSMTENEKNEIVELAKRFEDEFKEKFDIQRYLKIFTDYYERRNKIQAYAAIVERKNHIWLPEEKQLLLLYAHELPTEIPIAKGISELESLLGIQGNKLIKAYYRFVKGTFQQKQSDHLTFGAEDEQKEAIQTIFGYPVTIEKSVHTKNQKEIWLVSFKDKIPKDIFADIKVVMQSNQGRYYNKKSSFEKLRSKFVFFKEPTFFDAHVVVKKLENTFIKKEKEKENEYEDLENRLILVEKKMKEILQNVKQKAV